MSVTQEKIDDLTALLKVEIAKTDYIGQVEHVAKDLGKKVHVRGFRKGKVPSGVIKKMYGQQILADELNKILQDRVDGYIKDQKLEILGQPLPSEEEQNRELKIGNDYTFTFELGLRPEFDLKKVVSPKTKFTKNEIIVDDEIYNEELEKLQKYYGEVSHPETIEKDDVLQVNLQEVLSSGVEKENGISKDTSIPLSFFHKRYLKEVQALKKGLSVVVKIFRAFDKEKEEVAKHILEIDDDQIGKIETKFRITLKEINRIQPHEVNQELFDKVYGNSEVKSLDEFKSKFIQDIQKYYDIESDNILNTEIFDKLLDSIKIPLPDGFLLKLIKRNNEEEHTEEQLNADYEKFARSLRWQLITGQLIRENDLQVEDEELLSYVKGNLKNKFNLAVAPSDEDEQRLDEIAKQFLQNEEYARKSIDNLMDEKIFKFLRDTFSIKQKEVNSKKFKELLKKAGK